MQRTSIAVLCALLAGAACPTPSHAGPIAPTPIKEFKGDFAVQFAKTGSPEAVSFVMENGEQVVKVREEAKLFPGMGITLSGFDGMKSVYVAFDLRTANIARNATMAYYWMGAAGKTLTSAVVPVKIGGTTGWTRYEKILSSPMPLQTKGIRVVFLVWRAAGEGYALYRKPTIRIATQEDSKRVKEASMKPRVQPTATSPTAESFNYRFTNKMRGVSYDVERGGYGWLLLWGRQPLKDIHRLRIVAPDSVAFELYLFRGGKAEFVPGVDAPPPPKGTSVFEGLNRFRWPCWGNVLLFKAGADAPRTFDLSLTFADRDDKPLFIEPIPIRVIEPLNLPSVETRFENRVYYAHPFRWIAFDDERATLANGLLHYLRSRGFTSAGYLTEAKAQPFPEEKGEVISHFTRMPYRFNRSPVMAEAMKTHGIPMAMAASGIRSETELETQVVADKGVAFYADMLRKTGNDLYRGRQLVWLNDYEPYAFEGPATQYSFAPESLAAFRAFIGLPADADLTPKIVLTTYAEQWVIFRCRQHALVIKAQADALKAFSPQALYALSSESLPGSDEKAAEFFRRSGLDLRLLDPYVDMHLPMIYSQNATYYRRTEATVAQLQKPVFPTITCGYGNSVRNPERLRRLMVAAAFLDAAGVYHWPGFWGMDGNEMQSNQQAMSLIAGLEPFLERSRPVARNGQLSCPEAKPEHLYFAVRSAVDEHLIFIANDGKNETYYPLVRLPEATKARVVSTFPDGEILSSGEGGKTHGPEQLREGIRVKIPPASMTILRFGPRPVAAEGTIVDTRVWEREYRALAAAAAARSRGRAENGMSYRLDGAELVVETPKQRLKLSMADCAVGEWSLATAGGRVPLLDFLGRESFDFPGVFRLADIPAKLEKVEFTGDAIVVVVYYRVDAVPYEGLAFRKTFTVARDAPRIAVKVSIAPASGFRQFALRVVHGINAAGSRFRLDGRTCAPCEKLLVGNVYTRKNTDFAPFVQSKRITKVGVFSQDRCGLLLPGGKWVVGCDFEGRVRGLMNWHDEAVDTMELMYDKAYDHDDPHRAAVWECSYTLVAQPTQETAKGPE